MAGAGDGEFGRKRDCLWVGPVHSGGFGPDIDRVSGG